MQLQEALATKTVDDLKRLRALTSMKDRSTRKAEIVAAIAEYLLSGDLAEIWGRLAAIEIDAIAETVHNWDGRFDKVRFRAKYGDLPEHFSRSRLYYSWREHEQGPPSLLPLFFYGGEIPEDLRPRLAALAQRPAEVQVPILTDEDLPKTCASGGEDEMPEPLRQVVTEPMIRNDLPAVLRLIAQGRITVGAKTGVPGKASAKKLEEVLLGGDWYSEEDDPDLERYEGGSIRPIRPYAWPSLLQVAGLVKRDGNKLALTPRGTKALSQPIEETVKHLFERWQRKGRPDELRRIDLIKGQTSRGVQLTAPPSRRAVVADALRAYCPKGGWLDIDELFRQMQMNGLDFEVSRNIWNLYIGNVQYGSLGYEGYGSFAILQARYILVYLFEYLATLGVVDVAYTGPVGVRDDYGDIWGTDEFLFLSRYDGLRYIRLNPLGAYCLGLVEEYQPTRVETPSLFVLGDDLEMTLLREPQPAETLVLERIARPLAPDRWRLDPDAVLESSADEAERTRIREFLEDAADGPVPQRVKELLDTVAERATALSDVGAARMIRCKDKSIAALLASDPATAAHCVRAGDRLVCVAEAKVNAFRKGLAKLGFVLPGLTDV